jgi:hypothetical protein
MIKIYLFIYLFEGTFLSEADVYLLKFTCYEQITYSFCPKI